ncbi:MAG: hypothetical protein GYB65_14065 [Chloroflexi bacterium]|nr:hypothetical protein [Chloroflexota bacterium]
MQRLSALHALIEELTTDAPVLEVRIGLRWTIVVVRKNGQPAAGISSTVLRSPHHTVKPAMPLAGGLTTRTGQELVQLLHSDNPLEAGVGLATLNALQDVALDQCADLNAGDLIVESGVGKNVAIIGHFPFVPDVRRVAEAVWVLEQNPSTDELPADRAPEILPQADIVAITGMTLVNHTFDELIALCRSDALVLVLGGSTPLSPFLFDYGVDVLAGTRIVDIPPALRAISQGAGFRQIPGKRLLAMQRHMA